MQAQVGARMRAMGLVHDGIELSFGGARHRIDFRALTGKSRSPCTGRHEVTKDLIDGPSRRERPDACSRPRTQACRDFAGDRPSDPIPQGRQGAGAAAAISSAGCDGFHGVCRQSVPHDALTLYERTYPFSWLGILSPHATRRPTS